MSRLRLRHRLVAIVTILRHRHRVRLVHRLAAHRLARHRVRLVHRLVAHRLARPQVRPAANHLRKEYNDKTLYCNA